MAHGADAIRGPDAVRENEAAGNDVAHARGHDGTRGYHADFVRFDSQASVYQQLVTGTEALVRTQRRLVTNTANAASLIWHAFQELKKDVNWAGFYFRENDEFLCLGPFQGKVACQRIRIGKGVCGTVFATRKPLIVPDVAVFDGHIACDSDTNSEIVVPILTPPDENQEPRVLGVIDIDSAKPNAFDQQDLQCLQTVAELLAQHSDW